MIDSICFFNYFHNGDLFLSREFVSIVSKKLKNQYNCFYAHHNHKKVIGDLDISSFHIKQISKLKDAYHRDKLFQIENTLFVNTWIGSYMKQFATDGFHCVQTGCNLIEYQKIWNVIVKVLSEKLKIDLSFQSKNILDYIPVIDYEYYNISKAKQFIDENKDFKKIIISNGPVHSGQSFNVFNYDDLVNNLALSYPNFQVIATKKYQTELKNILFAEDIIGDKEGCDLNEISYLSTFCDILIGRNSGPFCFMNVKENIENKNKIIISLGNTDVENYLYNVNTPINCQFFIDNNFQNLFESLKNALFDYT